MPTPEQLKIVPHVGDDGTRFDQNQIFLGKKRLGYCGTKPGRPINLIVKVSPELKAGIEALVEREIGAPNKTSVAPEVVEDPDGDE